MYFAAALQTKIYGCRVREGDRRQPRSIARAIDGVMFTGPMEGPVKLIALCEGALQGFHDEITDMPHLDYCERLATTVPGPEVEALATKARQHRATQTMEQHTERGITSLRLAPGSPSQTA